MSVARSMRATGKANAALVGQKANIGDHNATRDVTTLLDKSGLSLQVQRDLLVPRSDSKGKLFLKALTCRVS